MVKKKRRIYRIVGCPALLLVVFIGVGFWLLNWMMSQPLYSFGSVRAEQGLRAPLEPPMQNETEQASKAGGENEAEDKGRWQVEPDISLAYAAYGNGEPVLVVHGGPGVPYQTLWKGLEPLTDGCRFYFYHQRGCGDSTRPIDRLSQDYYSNLLELDKTLGIAAHVADIERIRRILGREKLTIMGHSYGGFLAAMYAAEFPQRVDKLILVAPAGVLSPPTEETDIFAMTRDRLSASKTPDFDLLMKEYLDFGGIFAKSDGELVELHERMGKFVLEAMGYVPEEIQNAPRSGGWAVFALYLSGGRRPNFASALKEIVAPTLILHGQDDEIALVGSQSYRAISGSKFVIVAPGDVSSKAGHMVFDDSTQSFADAVLQFLCQ